MPLVDDENEAAGGDAQNPIGQLKPEDLRDALRDIVRAELRVLHGPPPPMHLDIEDERSPRFRERDGHGARDRRLEEGYGDYGRGFPREDYSVKVRAFDPKDTEWFAYRTHFLSLAEQAAWSDRTCVTRLMGALQGSMAGVTAGLVHPITFDSLLSRVDEIHGGSNSKDDALLKLENIKDEGEGVALFAERIRQLSARAYPNYTEGDREEQALRIFLRGLSTRGEFRMRMKMEGFRTLRGAVDYGVRLEQVLKDERGITRNSQSGG